MPETLKAPDYSISHNVSAGQWEVRLADTTDPSNAGAVIAYLSYDLTDDSILLTHTVTIKKYQGLGIAGKLVHTALSEISSEGEYSVVPVCPYVERYIEKHPEFQSLLASEK